MTELVSSVTFFKIIVGGWVGGEGLISKKSTALLVQRVQPHSGHGNRAYLTKPLPWQRPLIVKGLSELLAEKSVASRSVTNAYLSKACSHGLLGNEQLKCSLHRGCHFLHSIIPPINAPVWY